LAAALDRVRALRCSGPAERPHAIPGDESGEDEEGTGERPQGARTRLLTDVVVAAHLDDINRPATKKRWSPAQLLEHLADQESQASR